MNTVLIAPLHPSLAIANHCRHAKKRSSRSPSRASLRDKLLVHRSRVLGRAEIWKGHGEKGLAEDIPKAATMVPP
jgi:hypothetical protein